MTRERAKELLPVIQAFAEGKEIQIYLGYIKKWDTITDPLFDNSTYRIKPEPKYRPWKPEEVPVGAMIRGTSYTTTRYLIVGITKDKKLLFGTGAEQELNGELETYEHSLDHGKTWQPCGVLE